MTPDERDEAATAAPRAVTVRGRTFLVSKAKLSNFLTVRAWVKKRVKPTRAPSPLADALPELAALPPELQRIVVEKAAERQFANGPPKPAAISPEDALDALTSPEGCRFLLWLHARAEHPELTLEELTPLIDEGNAAEVFLELDEATGMTALAGRQGNPAGPPS